MEAAVTEMHGRQDALLPGVFAEAEETTDTDGAVEWRRWELEDRPGVPVVNARAEAGEVELGAPPPDPDQLRRSRPCHPGGGRRRAAAAAGTARNTVHLVLWTWRTQWIAFRS